MTTIASIAKSNKAYERIQNERVQKSRRVDKQRAASECRRPTSFCSTSALKFDALRALTLLESKEPASVDPAADSRAAKKRICMTGEMVSCEKRSKPGLERDHVVR